MTIPAVMFIEMAVDMIKGENSHDVEKELGEFRMLGNQLEDAIGSFPDGCTEVEKGYLIGVETARAMLATMPNAIMHDVAI